VPSPAQQPQYAQQQQAQPAPHIARRAARSSRSPQSVRKVMAPVSARSAVPWPAVWWAISSAPAAAVRR
jgi:hypothetical protein